MTEMVTINRAILQDALDDLQDYAASREFKERERMWREVLILNLKAALESRVSAP